MKNLVIGVHAWPRRFIVHGLISDGMAITGSFPAGPVQPQP